MCYSIRPQKQKVGAMLLNKFIKVLLASLVFILCGFLISMVSEDVGSLILSIGLLIAISIPFSLATAFVVMTTRLLIKKIGAKHAYKETKCKVKPHISFLHKR